MAFIRALASVAVMSLPKENFEGASMRGRFRKHWAKLFVIKDTPQSVALGTAIGISFGFTPLFGMKVLLSLLLALVLRANKIAAVVGVALHDVVLPLRPVLYYWEFAIGYWLLYRPERTNLSITPEQLHLRAWLTWETFASVGAPMLLGSVILGVPAGLLSFYVVRAALNRRQFPKQELSSDLK